MNDIDAALIASQLEIDDLRAERGRYRLALEKVQEGCVAAANGLFTGHLPEWDIIDLLRESAAMAAEALKHR